MPPKDQGPPGDSRSPNGHKKVALDERAKLTTAQTREQTAREVARRMYELFRASDRSHVTYRLGSEHRRESDGKIVPEYRTVKKPVTVDLWRQHLAGTRPLSVALACDDGTSRCSVVDYDDYSISAVGIANTVRARKLPFFTRPSKSGGAHVFAFHDVPIPTADAEAFARAMADALGVVDESNEYFPKVQGPDSLPMCVNMPFLGRGGGFIKVTGAQMTVSEFLNSVEMVGEEQRAAMLRSLPPVRRHARTARSHHAASPVEIDNNLADKMAAETRNGVSTNPDDYYDDDLWLELETALEEIPADCDRKTWLLIGAGIFDAVGEDGFIIWDRWSASSDKYDAKTMQRDWVQARDKFRNQSKEFVFSLANRLDPKRLWKQRYDEKRRARRNAR